MVHGATRAQLDPAHAQRVIGITDTGDQGMITLAACQAYAKESQPRSEKEQPGWMRQHPTRPSSLQMVSCSSAKVPLRALNPENSL
jgi:hypothetical protein